MAKRPSVDDLTPQTRVRRAARLVLTSRLQATWKRLPAARAGQVEDGIHQMRVAAKQLREAMRLFRRAYYKGRLMPIIEQVDQLNDRLGPVRDADVLMEEFEPLVGLCGSTLIADFRASIAAARAQHLVSLVELLDRLHGGGFRGRVEDTIVDARHGRDHPVAGLRLGLFSRVCIGKRLNEVVTRLRAVQGEHDVLGLHGVRVANKKLRYAIEPFLPVYDRRLELAYGRVVELHKALGDVHDLDVMAQSCREYAAHAGRDSEAALVLEEIDSQRGREFGRVIGFVQTDSIDDFAQLVGNAID